jgi:protein associated with RNAse G/E
MKNNNNKTLKRFAYPAEMAKLLSTSVQALLTWRQKGIIQESSYFINKRTHLYHVESVEKDLLTWSARQKASHGHCPDCVCALEKSAEK